MSINKNVVEDALFQIRNLEETLQENAKGILQSTMSEEIKQLVKESLKEQEEIDEPTIEDEDEMEMDDISMGDEDEMGMEDEMDMEDEMGMDDEDEMGMDDMSMDDEDEMGMEDEMDMEDAIDMTDASDEEVLKVFRAMGDEDGIVVKKEGDFVHLSDDDDDYLIQLGESYEENDLEEEEFGFEEDLEEGDYSEYHEGYNTEFDESEEKIYEIVMDDDFEEVKFDMEEEYDSLDEEDYDSLDEEGDYNNDDLESALMEAIKKSIKPKGVGIGRGPKFGYDKKPNMSGGFNEKKKEAFGKGTKAMGTGKAKFEFKEGEYGMNKGDKSKTMKGKEDYTTKKGMTNSKGEKAFGKEETKEASRTYGNGSKDGSRGLRKARMNNRNFEYNPFKISESRSNEEVQLLREKNEEYKQALDVFRTKLNEVAVFNSNLAYATRLFTEHSTTKQEKINILRRFDNIESLKESKNLYKTIKGELSSNGSVGEQKINESIERTVNKTAETGSAVNLIESKTYENPQFLRMKDLMGKLK
jgi:hypothetical protein